MWHVTPHMSSRTPKSFKVWAGCIHKKKITPPQKKTKFLDIPGGVMKYLATCFQCLPMPCIPEVDLALRPRFCWITARIPKIGQVERIAADKDGILTRSIAKAATLPCTGVNAPTTHHPNKNLVQPKPPSRSCQCCHLSAAVAAETSRNGEALLSSPKGRVCEAGNAQVLVLFTIYSFTYLYSKKRSCPKVPKHAEKHEEDFTCRARSILCQLGFIVMA